MPEKTMKRNLATEYKGRILEISALPALPAVLEEVSKAMESPRTSTEQIAKIIGHDQALAAKVLRMVNSPVYGFPGRIVSLQHALMLLGFNVIRGLIISTVVFDSMDASMRGLWEHSLGCSVACGEIARITGYRHPEEYAVAGLLHDIGKSAFAIQIPEAKAEVDALVAAENISFYEAEIRILGFGHDYINKWLGEHWNLPLIIREGMEYHHAPLRAKSYPEAAAAVQLGNFVARLFECGFSGDKGVSLVDPHCLKILGLNQNKLEELLDSAGEQMSKTLGRYVA